MAVLHLRAILTQNGQDTREPKTEPPQKNSDAHHIRKLAMTQQLQAHPRKLFTPPMYYLIFFKREIVFVIGLLIAGIT
jgi:hypothetical protein